MKKRAISLVLALVTVVTCLFSVQFSANAASISSNKHTATGVKGGQCVYITSNTGWNTELFGNTYRTKIQITLPASYYEYFQYNLSTGACAKMRVDVYKKSGGSWVRQSNISGTFNCNNRGVLSVGATSKTFVLPGKGVHYKVKITPVVTDPVSSFLGYSKASDYKNIKVAITSYGTITSVS
ncbi:MAG: hypothetical protein IKW76_03645 [Clostridia bacterium]|nr:hypothetical protein [Clostridia bacterium]